MVETQNFLSIFRNEDSLLSPSLEPDTMTDFTGIDAYEFLIIEWDSKNVGLIVQYLESCILKPKFL